MTSDERSREGVGFGSLPLPDEHLIDRKDSSNNTAADMMSSSQKKTRVVIKAPTSSDTSSGGGGGGYDDFLGYLQSSTAPAPQSKRQKEDDNHSESSDDISWSDILDGNTSTTATTNRGDSPNFTNFLHSLNIQETPANRKIKTEKEAEAHEIFLEFWNSEAGSKARLDNNFKVFNNIQKNSPEAIWSEIVAGMQNGEVVEQPFWSSLKSWFGAQPSTAAVVEGKQHEQQPEEITDVSSCDEIV